MREGFAVDAKPIECQSDNSVLISGLGSILGLRLYDFDTPIVRIFRAYEVYFDFGIRERRAHLTRPNPFIHSPAARALARPQGRGCYRQSDRDFSSPPRTSGQLFS